MSHVRRRDTGRATLHSAIDKLAIILENLTRAESLDVRLEERNETPLIWAVGEGYVDIALTLVEAGARLDAQNSDGNTALLRAACVTYLRREHTIANQLVAPFTGEGAYHGSTKKRAPTAARRASPVVEEMRATTIDEYPADGSRPIASFTAAFPNLYEVVDTLPIPSQEDIRSDGTTFVWCPFELALSVAGPLTQRVLAAMRAKLVGDKRHIYVDSKIQYLEPGDVPVDSQHWHFDGSIVARGPAVEALGHNQLHDMKARMSARVTSPRYLAYQTSDHCATLFITQPVTLAFPELVPNFDALDAAVRVLDPPAVEHPAGAIVRTDGRSLHRARPAVRAGWRLWIRCVETDREVQLETSIVECYNTVFRTR
jgi:hypothetical protein